MAFPTSKCALFFGIYLLSSVLCQDDAKQPKLSIFNIIKFENAPCIGGTRNGTCFTAAECDSNGGTSDGDCADGFGVCCTVTISSGGSTSLNQSFIVHTSTDTINVGGNSYTVCPCSSDICRIRFDFTVFTLAGPNSGTTGQIGAVAATAGLLQGGAVGDCLQDTFSITSSGGQSTPLICGANTGQHMIVDNDGNGCSIVNVGIGSGTFSRAFDIMITQYRCGDEQGGPKGCLQYFDQTQNSVRTFNFPATARGTSAADTVAHISNQNYQVCIRRGTGMFQICWIACTSVASAAGAASTFGVSVATAAAIDADVDSGCTTDYITIPNASVIAAAGSLIPVIGKTRFCGRYLHTARATAEAANGISVCSTAVPFRLGVNFDDNEVIDAGATANLNEQAGFPGGILGFNLCYLQS